MTTTTTPLSLDVALYYKGSAGQAADEIVRQAFQEAVQYFSTELTQDEVKRQWIAQHTSIADVLTVVQQAQAKHAVSKSKYEGRFRRMVVQLPERLLHYSGVIDVFASAHPEYSALAWGAIKFVLLVRSRRPVKKTFADYDRESLNMQSYSQRFPRASFSWVMPSRRRTLTASSTRPAS